MPATVRVEAEVWGDPRFRALARALGCDWHSAIGRMVSVWAECTKRCSYVLSVEDVAMHLDCDPDQVVPALCARAHLAVETPGGLRIKGTEGRIEWLKRARENGKTGGKKRASRADRKRGKFVSKLTPGQGGPGAATKPPLADSPRVDQAGVTPTATATATATATELQLSPTSGDRRTEPRREWQIETARLKRLREKLGMRQVDLAAKLFVNTRRLSAWERGHERPSENELARWQQLIESCQAAEPKKPGDHQRFIAHFDRRFIDLRGSRPTWNGKSGNQVRQLLKTHSVEELEKRLDNMERAIGTWPISSAADFTLDTLVRHIDRWADAPTRTRSTVSPDHEFGTEDQEF